MFEIHSVGPLYQIIKPKKIVRDRKQPSNEGSSSKKQQEREENHPDETTDQHIDEIV